jgi:hypothetical protein
MVDFLNIFIYFLFDVDKELNTNESTLPRISAKAFCF